MEMKKVVAEGFGCFRFEEDVGKVSLNQQQSVVTDQGKVFNVAHPTIDPIFPSRPPGMISRQYFAYNDHAVPIRPSSRYKDSSPILGHSPIAISAWYIWYMAGAGRTLTGHDGESANRITRRASDMEVKRYGMGSASLHASTDSAQASGLVSEILKTNDRDQPKPARGTPHAIQLTPNFSTALPFSDNSLIIQQAAVEHSGSIPLGRKEWVACWSRSICEMDQMTFSPQELPRCDAHFISVSSNQSRLAVRKVQCQGKPSRKGRYEEAVRGSDRAATGRSPGKGATQERRPQLSHEQLSKTAFSAKPEDEEGNGYVAKRHEGESGRDPEFSTKLTVVELANVQDQMILPSSFDLLTVPRELTYPAVKANADDDLREGVLRKDHDCLVRSTERKNETSETTLIDGTIRDDLWTGTRPHQRLETTAGRESVPPLIDGLLVVSNKK
ncbi:hypothetical protein SODALDRAFT_354121 [Sodiomyces alkalinus F11]|uniref:Uncharacterized protein n=1 Tax=Sodiomyces alkalinus (strain CBS 110278 / VKM F-3762 / F11) TaxID=1314773 RepID=A0A3N2Q5F2_SODAK|nr:hypothetical protein SODALDRAFT_354121 [Sodiomyces alkalinus F11]ROT42003.1 hypothetical protein SODALDRAFT_354121 [Sodiomyces alkalinus F11]